MKATLLACGFLVALFACSSSTTSSPPPADVPDAATPAGPSSLTPITSAHIGSDSNQPDFHKATGDVDFTGGPFASATLVVDLASSCFPFDQWTTNPPPAGQNYPASCDAFDRNFETSLVDPAGGPGLELIRAITPFGGPEHIERDITDVVNALHDKRQIQIMIPSYSDGAGKISGSAGGWTVTARIDLVPGDAPNHVLGVYPLVYDDQTKSNTTRSFPITMPPGTTSARVEYLATGHGGATATGDLDCIGPADEFCKRTHTLSADGAAFMDKQALWRTDCTKNCTVMTGGPFKSYCEENPCGDMNSVKAPRANWCPGTETPPLTFTPPQLATPGAHTVDLLVSKIADGDANWEISLKVFALGD